MRASTQKYGPSASVVRSLAWSGALCIMSLAGYADATETTIETPSELDIYNSALLIEAEIEQIRYVIGRPSITRHKYNIQNAQPRHLHSVAQTTFSRVNQLAQEFANAERRTAPHGSDVVSLADVAVAFEALRGQLQLVKRALQINEAPNINPATRRKDMNDALLVLGDAGRQMNVILGRSITWDAFYDRVELAMTYVAGALPESARYPALPPLEVGMAAPDIFAMLAQIRDTATEVAKKVDVAILSSGVVDESKVIPDLTELEAYDLMTIILSDLAELTLAMDALDADPPPYPRPSNIVGSHVYQLLASLDAQLQALGR